MNAIRIALVAGAIALLSNSESRAQGGFLQIEPDNGYAVQALVYYKPGYKYGSGTFWKTVNQTFETQEQAQLFVNFLNFLSLKDWNKMLDVLGFPNYIYVYGAPDFRIIPLYSPQQLIPLTQLRFQR